MPEIHLELLLGKRVRDNLGKPVGRIEEIRAEQQGSEWIVCEYLPGAYGWCERFSAWSIIRTLVRRLGGRTAGSGYRIAWSQLDLTDPAHPRLRCTREDLLRIMGE
jgi:hypothetical protein